MERKVKSQAKKEASKQKYIVRCHGAGVFFGEVARKSAASVVMRNVRKLWHWDGACAVEQLAVDGTSAPENCHFTVVVPEMEVSTPIQIIPCTDKAARSIEGVKEWRR